MIYGMVVIAGLVLVWMIYADQGIEMKPEIAVAEPPLILVDGKVPPKLSNFVAHMQYIDAVSYTHLTLPTILLV